MRGRTFRKRNNIRLETLRVIVAIGLAHPTMTSATSTTTEIPGCVLRFGVPFFLSLISIFLQPIKFSHDDDKYYQSPVGYGYNNERNRGYYGDDDPSRGINPLNDGFHEQFRVENENLQKYLNEVDQKSSLECSLNVGAQWLFENNVNEATQLEAVSLRA